MPSAIANWLISKVIGFRLHDYGCTLKAYRAKVEAQNKSYNDKLSNLNAELAEAQQ